MVTRISDRGRAALAARHPNEGRGADRTYAGRFSEELRRKLDIRSGDPAEPYADALDKVGLAVTDNIETAIAAAITRGVLRPLHEWGIYAIIGAVFVGGITIIATDNWRAGQEKARYAQGVDDLRARYQAEFERSVVDAVNRRMERFEPLAGIVNQLTVIEARRPGYGLWAISPAAEELFDDRNSEIILGKEGRKN